MIGKVVEHIIEKGYDIWIHHIDDPMLSNLLLLHISKRVGEEIVGLTWALSPHDLNQRYDHLLTDECDSKLLILQKEIEAKQAQ